VPAVSRNALDTDVAIDTPEHIVFRYRIAGPVRRCIAYVLDAFLCGVIVAAIGIVVLLLVGAAAFNVGSEAVSKAGGGVMLVVLFFVEWVYRILCEGFFGTSPGKRALGLRVVTTDGRPIGFGRAILRNLLRAADVLPVVYLVGVASMIFTTRFQRLGDLVAGTMVVVPERRGLLAPLVLYPPLHPQEHYVYDTDIPLGADDLRAIELLLRRRGRLGYAREFELASMITEPLATRFGVRHHDPVRLLALLYDRAMHAGRRDSVPQSVRGRYAASQPPGPAGVDPRTARPMGPLG
jgi:uncharacterized RDD family membrane protein YckC